MRVLVDLSTNEILQVERSPEEGSTTQINGKYPIEVPAGSVPVDSSSYVLPVDGGDFTSLSYDRLVDRYPQFSTVVFNPLLRPQDVGDLDLTATLDNSTNQVASAPYTGVFGVRAQVGRQAGPQSGLVSLGTAILAPNEQTTPPRPGVLITDTIDISAATAGLGASEFLVYWKVYRISVSEDIISDFGIFAGVNEPALKSLEEIDPEVAGFVVAISVDDGLSYEPVGHLQPFSSCISGTNVRLAFVNTTPEKIYLSTYGILF